MKKIYRREYYNANFTPKKEKKGGKKDINLRGINLEYQRNNIKLNLATPTLYHLIE